MHTYDLVIRGGTIVDGSGRDGFIGDVAISNGRIAAIGTVEETGREEIDAQGLVVTPGFVDIHTHYDAQATWSNRLSPSSNHGVTTVVTGNCGIGFAPCRPEDRELLVTMMEGVEDIPGAVMADGLPWEWESFPEFMDYLGKRQFDMDIAVQLPHSPVRVYTMGKRGLDREPANPQDIEKMVAITQEAMRAGAIGVSTSRTLGHRGSDRNLMPSITSTENELLGIAQGIKSSGMGVLQCYADLDEEGANLALMRRIVEKSQIPLSFSLMQIPNCPDRYESVLAEVKDAHRSGHPLRAQVFPRPVGVIIGMKPTFNFFSFCPSYQPISHLPVAERVAAMRDPELRKRIVSEYPTESPWDSVSPALNNIDNIFVMDEVPDYEPDRASLSIGAQARARGMNPAELAYDLLIENDGQNIFYVPAANYCAGTPDAMSEMLTNDGTVLGLGDAGAHYGLVCDASLPTYMLTRWAAHGEDQDAFRLPLPWVIRTLTSEAAETVNLHDRGILAKGYRADINIIDMDKIRLYRPEVRHDLPTGRGRLFQATGGYVATLVNGEITYRDGEATDKLPGRLVRGAQAAPASA